MSISDFTDHSRPECCPPASGAGRRDLGSPHAPAVASSGPATPPPVVVGPDSPEDVDVVPPWRLVVTVIATVGWIGFVVWVVVSP